MKIFVAGATGAIGRPSIAELVRQGHTVTGMTRSAAGKEQLARLGAAVAQTSALDAEAVLAAVRSSQAEVMIDQLTALPKSPADMAAARAGDAQLRIEGGRNLLRAAEACGVRRYLQQSSGFLLQAAPGRLADESDGMLQGASPGVAFSASTYAELEARLAAAPLEGVALRYGIFYGPGTWYSPGGACADQVRRQEIPIIGEGQGVWSWVHIDDAALATVAALSAEPGVYNLVDDQPSPVSVWLPAFAQRAGAAAAAHQRRTGPPAGWRRRRLLRHEVLWCVQCQGEIRTFGFRPRRLEWLDA